MPAVHFFLTAPSTPPTPPTPSTQLQMDGLRAVPPIGPPLFRLFSPGRE